MGFKEVDTTEESSEEITVAGQDQATSALKVVAILFLLGALAAAGRR